MACLHLEFLLPSSIVHLCSSFSSLWFHYAIFNSNFMIFILFLFLFSLIKLFFYSWTHGNSHSHLDKIVILMSSENLPWVFLNTKTPYFWNSKMGLYHLCFPCFHNNLKDHWIQLWKRKCENKYKRFWRLEWPIRSSMVPWWARYKCY